jgi:hypothetical protein
VKKKYDDYDDKPDSQLGPTTRKRLTGIDVAVVKMGRNPK